MNRTVRAVSESVNASLVGDGEIVLTGVSSVRNAKSGDLVFVETKKDLRAALESAASAVLAGEFAAQEKSSKPLLISSQPRLAFTRAARSLRPVTGDASGTHPSAVIHASARLGAGVVVEARAVVEEGVGIGEGTRIGAGTVVGAHVSIGRDCFFHPQVTIYPGAKIGDRVIVHAGAVLGSDGFGYVRDKTTGRYEKFPQIGRLEIGDDVEVGANSTIDRGALEATRIGRGTKIDNLVHIGHNCQIGEDVIMAAQAGLSGSVTLGKNVLLGGQVGIGEHARLGEGVMLGGQGGVLPNKLLRGKGVAFWGTPAQPVREYLKQLATLARLAKKE
jgi:UDP-3-O-[3-hydroxymyristoyl] glucosamine N-acyltransferase